MDLRYVKVQTGDKCVSLNPQNVGIWSQKIDTRETKSRRETDRTRGNKQRMKYDGKVIIKRVSISQLFLFYSYY